MATATRLKDKYQEEIVPALKERFNYKSVMQVPKLEKLDRESPCCIALTVYALSADAGEKLQATQGNYASMSWIIQTY